MLLNELFLEAKFLEAKFLETLSWEALFWVIWDISPISVAMLNYYFYY